MTTEELAHAAREMWRQYDYESARSDDPIRKRMADSRRQQALFYEIALEQRGL